MIRGKKSPTLGKKSPEVQRPTFNDIDLILGVTFYLCDDWQSYAY